MLFDNVQESVDFIRSITDFQPEVGIILGTGLGGLVQEIEMVVSIPYSSIPHFPEATVTSHKGELILGYLGGKRIAGLAGRFHYYEGYSMIAVTFPVRVLKQLGVHSLFISNAAGSVKANIEPGDLVIIQDHINLHAANPLRGKNDPRFGPRFPDMLKAYDPDLYQKAMNIATTHNLRVHYGVYVGLQGPNLETPAEYNFINLIGGAVVGMSSIPEVLVARHMDLRVFMVSIATNKCFPINDIEPATIDSVIAVAKSTQPKLNTLITNLLLQI